MKKCLFITLCALLALSSCISTKHPSLGKEPLHPTALFDTTHVSKYKVWIKTPKNETSGIMAWKYIDEEWRGSLINELGVKAFDFISPQGKCHLQNLISFLDKWYIRRTIESDFAFLFWTTGKNSAVKGKKIHELPDGTLVLTNEKYHIEYSFQRLNNEVNR
jgi:hypothetical protein